MRNAVSDATPERIIERYRSLHDIVKNADFGKYDNNIVVVDTETTGVSFEKDELIQIAAARIEGGCVVDTFDTFVNPGIFIPEDIQMLTRITNNEVVGAPSAPEAIEAFVSFAGDAVLVAHNAAFDKTFLTKHPEGESLMGHEWLDTLLLARIAFPRMRSHRLADLVPAFDLPAMSHRANDDVDATCALLRYIYAGLTAMPYEVLAEISKLDTPENWSIQGLLEYFLKQREDEKKNAPAFSFKRLRSETVSSYLRSEPTEQEQEEEQNEEVRENAAIVYPSEDQIKEAFSYDGLVGKLYSDFAVRDVQEQMAQAVAKAYREQRNIAVEAGTGVGKSMAYLIPSAMLASDNPVKVGIATKTNTLLDQLVYKELPALAQAMGNLSYCAVKGFANYPCLRKVERLVEEGGKQIDIAENAPKESSASALACLISYVEQTDYDDLSSLRMDYRLVPSYAISTTSQECLRKRCPYFGRKCFVHGIRKIAQSSDIVVTNHSMLFCDLKTDGGLLPPVFYWVLDEAHNAEEEARKAFSLTLSSSELLRLSNQITSENPLVNIIKKTQRKIHSTQLALGK